MKTYFLRILKPKPTTILAVLIITIGLFFGLTISYNYFGIAMALIGILGSILSAREILRKGSQQIVYEARHTDLGSINPSEEEQEEDRQTDYDALSRVYGLSLVLIGAIGVFVTEIIGFLEN